MSELNQAFEKLLEYQARALQFEPGRGQGTQRPGETTGFIFRIAEQDLTCCTTQVEEFLPLPPYTPVPGTKPWILGLANVHGDLVTIVDLGSFLFDVHSKLTPRSRMLLASLRGRPVGLVVDEVFGQRNFVEANARQVRLSQASPLHGYVKRQHRSGTETWQELDLDILFTTADFLNGAAS